MDDKEQGMILGELKSFKEATMRRLDNIEKKIEDLDKFKIKVTLIMALILGGIELTFRYMQLLK